MSLRTFKYIFEGCASKEIIDSNIPGTCTIKTPVQTEDSPRKNITTEIEIEDSSTPPEDLHDFMKSKGWKLDSETTP